jgi:hypothetical protein
MDDDDGDVFRPAHINASSTKKHIYIEAKQTFQGKKKTSFNK